MSEGDGLSRDAIRQALSDLENLQGTVDSLQEQMVTDDDLPEMDGEDPFEDLPALVETQTRAYLDHLATEDCSSEGCESLRERFGLDPSAGSDDDDHDHDVDESGAGGGGDDEGGDGDGSGNTGDSWPPEGW